MKIKQCWNHPKPKVQLTALEAAPFHLRAPRFKRPIPLWKLVGFHSYCNISESVFLTVTDNVFCDTIQSLEHPWTILIQPTVLLWVSVWVWVCVCMYVHAHQWMPHGRWRSCVLLYPYPRPHFVSLFCGRILLCSPGCPGTSYVNQVALEFMEFHLSLPPECWD